MTFCTTVNCMDGRVQLPVIQFLQQRFEAEYVDSVTEPGPIKAMAADQDGAMVASIRERVDISIHKHGSTALAIVAHYDCAGNPLSKGDQLSQLDKALAYARRTWPQVTVIGLWVDEQWQVSEVC